MPTTPVSRQGGEWTIKRCAAGPVLISLGLLLPVVTLLALTVGSYPVSPEQIWAAIVTPNGMEAGNSTAAQVVKSIRLPRVLLAATTGTCLALCGAVLQGLFRNPLADPSIIGVSSGASVGASSVIVFAALAAGADQAQSVAVPALVGLPAVAVGAFAGGLLATLLVYRLATSTTGTSVATMLLAGIAVSALAGALSSLFGFIADNEMLRRISLWQMGNLGGADWARVQLMTAVTLVLLVLLPRDSQALNAMLLGESEARYLGIPVEWLKRRLILLTAFGVGLSVALAGVLTFVGLIVPHLMRLLIGPDHRLLLPACALSGALLLVLADTLARVATAPAEMPTGIVTALLGAPFFIYLMLRQRRHLALQGAG